MTKSAYASYIHYCGGQQQGPDIGWQRMNTTMAPVIQVQQGPLEELRQRHDLPHEVSVGRKRNGIKRGLSDSNRNRNGNDNNNNDDNNNNNNKNSDNNPNTNNTRAKDRGFDFLNFGRSSSTAASIPQTTTPPPPPPPSTVPTTIVVTTTASSPSLPDASSVSKFEGKKGTSMNTNFNRP